MYTPSYFVAKILKKIRGKAIKNSSLHATSKIGSGSSFFNVRMNRYSYCGYDCNFLNCEIGSFCSIASNVIIGGMRHPTEYVSTSPVFLSHRDSIRKKFAHHSYLPVDMAKIGNDVWIGHGAIIKAGITIGHGAVIGMGAVVTKDVAPYAIIAGNPSKLIRMRFEPEVIDALLNLEWWSMSEDQLTELGPLFDDPSALLKSKGYL